MNKNKNVGKVDKVIRVILGIVFFVIGAFYVKGVYSIIFYILGFILLLTSITGKCCLYNLFGINTCKIKDNNQESHDGE